MPNGLLRPDGRAARSGDSAWIRDIEHRGLRLKSIDPFGSLKFFWRWRNFHFDTVSSQFSLTKIRSQPCSWSSMLVALHSKGGLHNQSL
jgi:hypothetical protein